MRPYECDELHINPLQLLAEMQNSVAQRIAGYTKQPLKRPVKLNNQEDRKCNRQRTDEHGTDNGCVGRRKEAEAEEDSGEPENQHGQHNQEWHRNRSNLLRKHQPARLHETEGKAERLGLERALGFGLRRQCLDFVIEGFGIRLRRVQPRRLRTVFGPHLIERADNDAAEQITGFFRFRSVIGQHPV